MNSVTINTISLNPDYQIYICDVYGNNCVFVALIPLNVPPSITLTLPTIYENAPSVGVKIINNGDCEKFEVLLCDSLIPTPTITSTPTITPTPTPTTGAVSPTPTPTLTPTLTTAPLICFQLENEFIGSNYTCSLSPIGYLNGRPYYGILLSDCLSSSSSIVFWNPTTNRWEHVQTSPYALISYNINPSYYPFSDGTYLWVVNYPLAIGYRILSSSGSLCSSPTPTSTPTPTRTPSLSTFFNSVKGTPVCTPEIYLIFTTQFNFYISSSSSFCTSCSVQLFTDSNLTTPVNSVIYFIVNTNEIWRTDTLGYAKYYNTVGNPC